MSKQLLLICLPFLFMLNISCDSGGDPNGDQLLKSAEAGDIAGMESALNTGLDINYISPNFLSTEQTACSKAALNGQLAALKWLVEKGADWRKATSGKENPISLAASNNHFEVVFYLIELGEDVNYQETNYGMTPLMHATDHGNLDAAKKLLALGADSKLVNKEIEDVMTIAAKRRRPQMIEFFSQKGIPFHLPLHTVAKFQNDTRLSEDDRKTIDVLIARGADINEMDEFDGFTPLHIASMWANNELMDYFISKGADRTIRTAKGMSTRQIYGHYQDDNN